MASRNLSSSMKNLSVNDKPTRAAAAPTRAAAAPTSSRVAAPTATKPTAAKTGVPSTKGVVVTDKNKAMEYLQNALKKGLIRPVSVKIGVPPIRLSNGTVEYDPKIKRSVFKPAGRR